MPAHQSIIDPTKIHEAKQIAGASTTDAGKIITPSSVTPGVGVLRKLGTSELTYEPVVTGWSQHADDQYTVSAKRTIGSATRTLVTINDLGAPTNANLPVGASAFWNAGAHKVVPGNSNDAYMIRLCFSVESSGGGTGDRYLEIDLDVGGTTGVIVQNGHLLRTGSAQRMHSNFLTVAEADFVANGGQFYITTSHSMNFWDFKLLISRIHKGA
jgi:hypothetical protein